MHMRKNKATIIFLCALSVILPVLFGTGLGTLLGMTQNIKNNEHFTEFTNALPTRLLDINGELITEFASDEKREMITLNELPQHLIDALITREDNIFFKHAGFSIKSIVRAFAGKLLRRSMGGGSTLTQQIAGTLYLDRTEITYTRKIKELWWAVQMERRYSKQEILELYLNKVYLGGGTYGVNAASKYYFGHSAREVTPAEAAILVIQLSNPGYYNPFEYPNRAMERQKYVLDEMAKTGFLSKDAAEQSFDDFWLNFDYTRINSSAYFMREDKAPWFSEFVRKELEKMMYGTMDVYTGGYTVHTTMNMKHQSAAQDIMQRYITWANNSYNRTRSSRRTSAASTYIPMTELLSLVFDIPQLKISEQRNEVVTMAAFKNTVNPTLDVLSLMFGIEELKIDVVNRVNAQTTETRKKIRSKAQWSPSKMQPAILPPWSAEANTGRTISLYAPCRQNCSREVPLNRCITRRQSRRKSLPPLALFTTCRPYSEKTTAVCTFRKTTRANGTARYSCGMRLQDR